MQSRPIRLLSDEVIGQIAAGEVVERPSAAIKELVENSMDAGASAITVEIREGGLSYFRVTDNGSGIAPSNIKMAFERHATSKISSPKDLFSIMTLGFRGEALASIAAVSNVTMTTRTSDQEHGISALNSGGVLKEIKDAACPVGTSIIVKDLFFNTPVRRKFLKKPSTETAYVTDLMAKLILSHPEISFRFVADKKDVYFSAGDSNLSTAILSVYGVQTLHQLVKVQGNMLGILIEGYVGVGETARGNRAHETFFINKRAMKSALLSSALESACRQRVMIGKFPMAILSLTMPYELVDVNVHPNKWEVRFQNEKNVQDAVQTIVAEALESTQKEYLLKPSLFEKEDKETVTVKSAPTFSPPIIPKEESVPIAQKENAKDTQEEKKDTYLSPPTVTKSNTFFPSYAPSFTDTAFREDASVHSFHSFLQREIEAQENQKAQETPPVSPVKNQVENQIENIVESTQTAFKEVENLSSKEDFRLLGALFHTYILIEYQDKLLLCDQHAAHERLLFDKLMKDLKDTCASQTFLFPLVFNLSHSDYITFIENQEVLQQSGFDVEPFGDQTVKLLGVPIVLGEPEAEACFMETLDNLRVLKGQKADKRTEKIMQMACKHAVKGGEKLSDDALLSLVSAILEGHVKPTCPHGRPLIITLTKTELEKRFKRIQ